MSDESNQDRPDQPAASAKPAKAGKGKGKGTSKGTGRVFRSKRAAPALDELGGTKDGGLAVVTTEGQMVQAVPTRVAAALRYLLARIQIHEPAGLPPRVAMTAALKGEGVSYLARSLAAVLAYDTDATVAVVDLNWRSPRPAGDGAEDEARPLGLADSVERDVSIDEVIITTTNPRLSLVPAGEAPVARRPALATGEALPAVLEELSARFDHLLLDLPPVLASAEAINLTQLADAYVLVVQQGATAQSQLEAAIEELRGAEPLGAILNRFDSRIPRRLRQLVGT